MQATPRETIHPPRTTDRSTPTPYQDNTVISTVNVELKVPDDKVRLLLQYNSIEPN